MTPHRLTSQSQANLRRLLAFKTKVIGQTLREADLISPWQLEAALQIQLQRPGWRLGEILAHQGILQQKTADFFVQDWLEILAKQDKDSLGDYLLQSGILDSNQVEVILAEQRATGVRFGTVAVFQGFVKSTTLDFFLTHLFPEELGTSPFVNMYHLNQYF